MFMALDEKNRINSNNQQRPVVMLDRLDDTDRRYLAALAAIRDGDLEKAITLFDSLLQENPTDFDCLLLLAECSLKVGDHLRALRAAKTARQIEPGNQIALSLLGMLYSRFFLHELAVDLLHQAVKTDENQEENYFYLSNSYFFLRENQRAIKILKKALAINPAWSRLRHQLGMLYLFEKDKKKAKGIARELAQADYPLAHDFMKMVEVDSPGRDRILEDEFKGKAGNLLREAEQCLRERNYSAAVKRLIAALEADDELAVAYTHLGKIFGDHGLIDEGLSLHKMAIHINPDLASAHNNLAYAFRMKGKIQPAMEAYQKALEIDPTMVEAHNSLGHLYDCLKDYPKGLGHFLKAFAIDPKRLTTLMNMGYVYREMGNIEESLKAYRLASEYYPAYPRSRYFMGDIYLEMEDYGTAERVFQEAVQIEPDSLFGWLKLAECYRAFGKEEKFQEAVGKVLSLPPKDPYEIFFVAKVMEDVDKERAIRHYQNFLQLAERIPLDPNDVAHVKARLAELQGPSN